MSPFPTHARAAFDPVAISPIASIPAVHGQGAPILSVDEVESYRAEGFLRVDRPVLDPEMLREVRRSLDALFARFDRIPVGFAQDLALHGGPDGAPRIPEINFTSVLAPHLLRSGVLRVCTQIARELHGPKAHLVFDHAIYKPPCNGAETPWHQDIAYAKPDELVVGIWVPLQAVGASDGCMRFVPGSHLGPQVEHEEVASATNTRVRVAHPDETEVVLSPVCEGGLVVHNVYTLHSTGPNDGTATRRVWILNFGNSSEGPSAVRRLVHRTRVRARIAVRRRPR
jgi:hypothetical protein